MDSISSLTRRGNPFIQLGATILGGLLGAALPVWLSAKLVLYIMTLVPVGAYAGLIKVGIIFFSCWLFGGATVCFALLGAVLLASLALALTE